MKASGRERKAARVLSHAMSFLVFNRGIHYLADGTHRAERGTDSDVAAYFILCDALLTLPCGHRAGVCSHCRGTEFFKLAVAG